MCVELLLIKGIVERLVERPRYASTMHPMKLHLAVLHADPCCCATRLEGALLVF